jgi:hypothetical protein
MRFTPPKEESMHHTQNSSGYRLNTSFLISVHFRASSGLLKAKNPPQLALGRVLVSIAENEGFEPPVPCGTLVFKTSAIDHSANSPSQK